MPGLFAIVFRWTSVILPNLYHVLNHHQNPSYVKAIARQLSHWLLKGLFHEERGDFLPWWYILTRLEDVSWISPTSFKRLQSVCHSWMSHPRSTGKGWSEDKLWDFFLAFNQLWLWGSHLNSMGLREQMCFMKLLWSVNLPHVHWESLV